MDRRKFIKRAGAAAAGTIIAPYILPSGRLFAASGGSGLAQHVVLVMFAGGVRQQESVLQRYLADSQGEPYEGCTRDEARAMREYQRSFARSLTTQQPRRAGSGYFIHNTHTHCLAVGADTFLSTTIKGVPMYLAVDEWWQSLLTPNPPWQPHMCETLFPEGC